ncbi:DUF2254 domain-containing protein [Flavobacteriaceae bacterium Ap0902]|nr:DUF2254 domain-containing protein [Flavobacteriaceae bacterium Ap0902]
MISRLKTLYWNFKALLKRISHSIAFIPGAMGLSGILLVILLHYIEELGITPYLVERIPYLLINNQSTASTVLSYLSAGIISIMVFSFSLVMILLNQAGNNFSPRVIPGLISVRKHQIIIGLYLGTLLYNTFVMIGIKPVTDQFNLPGFSILIGIMLTILCLFAFIYFIDSISKSIQVHSILESVFNKSKRRLKTIIKNEKDIIPVKLNTLGWPTYPTDISGYIRNINEQALINFCVENDCKIETLQINGTFITKGTPLFSCSVQLEDAQLKEVRDYFAINRNGEDVNENYVLGFKQITEIGIRAMSPGINDPGTAITTIDYLTELFSILMAKNEQFYLYKDQEPIVQIRIISFKELISQVMMSYRQYCKQDMSCAQKLIIMLLHLRNHPNCNDNESQTLSLELKKLMIDLRTNIENEYDLEVLEDLSKQVQI